MPSHDTSGREYARLSQTKVGDVLEADAGFSCIEPGSELVVKETEKNELYVECFGPRGCPNSVDFDPEEPEQITPHLLSGQCDDGDHMVGFYAKLER